jgi:hypothetical protein
MTPSYLGSLLAVCCLLLTAGCLGTPVLADDGNGPPTPIGTPVQGTTPTGMYDPTDSRPIAKFVSGASVCGTATTSEPQVTLTWNGRAEQYTVSVVGAVTTENVARYAPPAGLYEDAPGRYTLWVSTRPDPRRDAKACRAHVPYEAIFDLPSGTGAITLSVVHDGTPVGTWGPLPE